MQNKEKIILDCDPGHDDAVAIMLASASPKIELLGITVSSGNQTVEKTGHNALCLAEFLNISCPVCLGSPKPIEKEPMICPQIHGESGLDGVTLENKTKQYDKRDATSFIIETLLKEEDVTLVTTGPMTNVGLAMLKEPKIKSKIKQIVIMGGSITNGNVSPAAEFNILVDPEAANIVFTSGCKIYMCGLDVTRKVLVLPKVMERMKKINNRVSNLFYDLMVAFNKTQKQVFGLEGGPLHDPVTIVSLINKDVVTFQYVNVEIDISKGCSYGRTNCDVFNYLHKTPNAYVAVDINVDKYWDVIEEELRRYSK